MKKEICYIPIPVEKLLDLIDKARVYNDGWVFTGEELIAELPTSPPSIDVEKIVSDAIDAGLTLSTISRDPFTSKEFKGLKNAFCESYIASLNLKNK